MESKEVQSLDVLVKNAINNAICSEAIVLKVEAAANKAITEAIEAAFGYSSEFRKGITEAIKSALPIVDVTDLATFANAVRSALQQRLANAASDTAREHLNEVLEKLLPEHSVISIDDLKSEYIDKIKDKASSGHCDCEEEQDDPEITWVVEPSRDSSKYWDLWMSPEADASRYGGKDVVILRFRPVEGSNGLHECWHASVGGKDRLVDSLFAGPLYGFDAMVFRLATGTAKLQK